MSVSVIVATYGDASWEALARERAIPSASGQGATEIIQLHLSGGTLAEARNTAAAGASGAWLCFLDADDELAPGYLAAMNGPGRLDPWCIRDALLVPAVSYIRTPDARYPGVTKSTPPSIPNKGRWPELNIGVIGTLVTRAVFEAVGGFREFQAWEDWDLWLRCWKAGAELTEVPQAIYRAFERAGSRNQIVGREATELYSRIRRDNGI